MKTTQTSASDPACNQSAKILFAESRYFVGTFKVPCSQLESHPNQRPRNKDWTLSLKERFKDVGLDKASFPVKALLYSTDGLSKLRGLWEKSQAGTPPVLPEGFSLLVYDGQHRVDACELLDDPSEHWWYAEVYQKELELHYPAEFLAIMHLGNEKRFMMHTSDADRFMILHEIRCLLDNKVISLDVHHATQERILGAISKDITRHGLCNLMRSKELSKELADALGRPYIAPCFNAATWGKKLTIGRFYQAAADLIREMTTQCTLLQQGRPEVDAKPFLLTSQSCTMTSITRAANSNKPHAWEELEGGVGGALKRVSKRPPGFTTTLNPDGSKGWLLPDTILLPSVLTSTLIENRLRDMYHIAQHVRNFSCKKLPLIHIVAGPDYLELYTSNKPHSSEEDHPVGLIAIVLETGNSIYPHKIILQIWTQREQLLRDLRSLKISEAASTSVESYHALIEQSQEWWTLVRLLKGRWLPMGLRLRIPKEFKLLPPGGGMAANISEDPHSIATGSIDMIPQPPLQATTHMHPAGSEDHQTATSTQPIVHGKSGGRDGHERTTQSPGGQPNKGTNQAPAQPGGETAGPFSSTGKYSSRPRKRLRKEQSITTSEDEFEPAVPLAQNQRETGGSARAGMRCHTTTVSLLQDLERAVPNMRPEEARALTDLVWSLMSLQGTGHAARVIGRLAEKVKPLVGRAMKATEMSTIYDEEDENCQSDGENDKADETDEISRRESSDGDYVEAEDNMDS